MYVAILLPYRPLIAYIWGGGGVVNYADKKIKENFPHMKGNSEGIGCKVISEEGLPNT
jgi:hypothetical protein